MPVRPLQNRPRRTCQALTNLRLQLHLPRHKGKRMRRPNLRDVSFFQAPGSDSAQVIESSSDTPVTTQPLTNQGPDRKSESNSHSSQVSFVTSTPNRTSAQVVPPENIEPSSADETEGSETRAEKLVAENSQDQAGVESSTPTQDTVSASPLGAAGMPVERAVDEPGNLAPADEARADEVAIDISSAAVAAFWSALDMLPLASISAAADDSDDGLAATVIANFDSLTAAVDTLLDSLACAVRPFRAWSNARHTFRIVGGVVDGAGV